MSIVILLILAGGALVAGIWLLLRHQDIYGEGCPLCFSRYISREQPDGPWYCKQCGITWEDDADWQDIYRRAQEGK